ncbi:hypothetical protein GWI34_27960 [Actinomadura sp. DSM 109109]|nr:hypothetical protein [Actinomadura lepetitiana]
MLRLLDVADGMTVLEIGTGTGSNAALLSERLGSSQVVSVDIDHDLILAARDHWPMPDTVPHSGPSRRRTTRHPRGRAHRHQHHQHPHQRRRPRRPPHSRAVPADLAAPSRRQRVPGRHHEPAHDSRRLMGGRLGRHTRQGRVRRPVRHLVSRRRRSGGPRTTAPTSKRSVSRSAATSSACGSEHQRAKPGPRPASRDPWTGGRLSTQTKKRPVKAASC